DRAAAIIGAAISVNVQRLALGPEEAEHDPASGTGMVAALSEGQPLEIGYLMGAARPFEFEHAAAFELLVVGGDAEARRKRFMDALECAAKAIDADPTLGGVVDFAELSTPDPDDEVRYAALAAVLTLTYTAPNALG
ncbi:MAG: hypothetical protein ACK4X1_18400, partial [Terricaulis sp.]